MGLFCFIMKPEEEITEEDLRECIIDNMRLYGQYPNRTLFLDTAYNYMKDLRKKLSLEI